MTIKSQMNFFQELSYYAIPLTVSKTSKAEIGGMRKAQTNFKIYFKIIHFH